MSKTETIRQLAEQIRKLERPECRAEPELYETLTGIDAFDAMLPPGGLTGGTMLEWLSPQGGGGSTLVAILASRILTKTGTLVVVDSDGDFYPPAISGIGIAMSQIVVLRPQHIGDALWAFEQSLRCSGVAVTMAWFQQITDQVFRRLQLATETGGGIGFLIRPPRFLKQRSWADGRFLIQSIPEQLSLEENPASFRGLPNIAKTSVTRRLRVQLLHCRGRTSGGRVDLEINNETGHVHLASRLAASAPVPRKARA